MEHESELKSLLTEQEFENSEDRDFLLAQAKNCAKAYARATEGIAVVSDFQNNECHIYSGKFGQNVMKLPEYMADRNSAFENIVFGQAKEDELIERHILELRFFSFLKDLPVEEKTNFAASCTLSFYKVGSKQKVRMLHTTRYLSCSDNGSILFSLCTYAPHPASRNNGQYSVIINLSTGEAVEPERVEASDHKLLSPRQTEILSLIAKGVPSKQIADRLSISVFTVNRHRQDILATLKVANTAAAVEIALRMNLI